MPEPKPFSAISGRHLGPEEIASHSFPNARKGLDPEAVRRFLSEVASQVRDLRNERNELRTAANRPPNPPVERIQEPLDEASLTRALGEETTRVLQTARESASAIITKAESQAAELIAGAEAIAASRRAEADEHANALGARARQDAAGLIEKTKSECRQMIEEAREARRRILADLAERRRTLLVQLEQIRIGKESMIAVVESVATNVADSIVAVRAQLNSAEDSAKLAAERAAGELDGGLDGAEEIEAIVTQALAKLPRSGEEAVFTSFEGRDAAPEGARVFDIERESEPPAISTGVAGLVASEVSEVGPVAAFAGEGFSPPPQRIPDRTPTVGGAPGSSGLVDTTPKRGDGRASTQGVSDAEVTSRVSESPSSTNEGRPENEDIVTDAEVGGIFEAQGEAATREGYDDDEPSESGNEGPPDAATKGASPVDQLFARIRASRESRVADAQRVLSDEGASVATRSSHGRHGATETKEESARTESAVGAEQGRGESAAKDTNGAAAATVDELEIPGSVRRVDAGQETPHDAAASIESPSAREVDDTKSGARDALLQPAIVDLARALKRAFREEQNLILDGLRNRKKTDSLSALLPGEAARVRLIEAALPGIGVAYVAGQEFLSPGSRRTKRTGAENEAIAAIADRLAQEILHALHVRLVPAFTNEGEGETDFVEIVGSVFRDWKASRVETLAQDFVVDSFGSGAVAFARAKKMSLTWNFDDGGAECPDCDDNGVAGKVAAGEPFPTGHAHPPVHPGCRCFLSS